MRLDWFSTPQETIEAAQALHDGGMFNPAAVFITPENKYVMGKLSIGVSWPPVHAAEGVKRLTGYKMVSCCDPLLGIWKPFEDSTNG